LVLQCESVIREDHLVRLGNERDMMRQLRRLCSRDSWNDQMVNHK
jgi:hypothetical protein